MVSNRQTRWSRTWPGQEPVVVRNEQDEERILEEMLGESKQWDEGARKQATHGAGPENLVG